MAGTLTESSRMGITLQGYDQVIALSQANINETLGRHFSKLDASDELDVFEADSGELGVSSIIAKVLAPKIELIDEDENDKAIYIIRLGEGSYSTVARVERKLQTVEISTEGWELGFEIDFVFKAVKIIPDNIKRQVSLPGGYSVKQLMINFGDVTRVLQLNPKKCKFPVSGDMQGKVSQSAVEASMELFTKEYLKDKLATKPDHNILGFIVNVTEENKDLKPEFIPTDSKVQIVGHRVNGRQDTFKQDNPYNAFCFTEMTDKRVMPKTEIKYSGNWFYDSIGGTLAISRGTFWDLFMLPKIKKCHVRTIVTSCQVLENIATQEFKGMDWKIKDMGDIPAEMVDFLCLPHEDPSSLPPLAYGTTFKPHETTGWDKESSHFFNFWSKPRMTISTTAMPKVRDNKMVIRQHIKLGWEEGAELSGWFDAIALLGAPMGWRKRFRAHITGSLELVLQTTITLKSATADGTLGVESKIETLRNDYKGLEIQIGGIGTWFPEAAHKLINDWSKSLSENYRLATETMATRIKELGKIFANAAEDVERQLNNGNKFVFPGNGTFDMRDPVFNDVGDLMVGLTYQ